MRVLRTAIFLCVLSAIPVAAVAQPPGWRQFSVAETGASVDLPAAVFDKDAGSAESGYGRRFTTADGRANLAVQSMTNDTNASPAEFLAKKHPPADIAYRRITDRFFVVSSYRQGRIWYDRCNFSVRLINCVLINYPAAEKRDWDAIVTRISHSLSAG
jgi:hypothetical protein